MAAAEQLITENLDIWTSAVQMKSASGRGKSNKLELYGIKKLRELILELAVRGLLVPQDPNDEPASVLVFKTLSDPFTGKISLIRVVSGTMTMSSKRRSALKASGPTSKPIGRITAAT